LGGVQFGLDYGITNRLGKPHLEEVRAIFDVAVRNGVELIDTAAAYGDSESVIGKLDAGARFNVVTKLPPIKGGTVEPAQIARLSKSFAASLQKLGRAAVSGLLIHHAGQLALAGGERLIELLHEIKTAGQAEKVGVSVYNAKEIDFVLSRFTPDIVQLPVSVADQRLVRSGHLKTLSDMGVEIHARSLFLQGTLLCDPAELPAPLQPHRDQFEKLHQRAGEWGVSALELCLAYALNVSRIDRLIVGVASLNEFDSLSKSLISADTLDVNFTDLSFGDAPILDPSGWQAMEQE
tara:strand:- start:556 stop:1434 length:879 start_codon:yes stop_codon:yes gene_type:complete